MRLVPPLGGTDGDTFVDASPGTGVDGSAVPAEVFNAPLAEIIAVIQGAGITPDKDNLTQLLAAIDARIATIAGDPMFNGVVSVNGDTGPAVTFNFPVTTVNGQTGDVTVSVPVTSVNGQTGDVVLDLSAAVTSVNGQTGAVNITVPVDSVNGQTGVVNLTAADVGGVPETRQVNSGTGLSGGGALTSNRTLSVNFASQADVRAGVLDEAIAPNALQAATLEVVLTFGSTLAWTISDGFNFVCDTISSNFTIANPSGQVAGRTGTLRLYSPVARTISWGSQFRPAFDSLPTEVLGEIVLGYSNAYNGRMFIA